MQNEYNKIKTPQELLKFMSNNITYGYLGNSGRVYYYQDFDFNDKWEEEYILETKDEVLNNLVGNCWDQVEFAREWFLNHNYEVKTFFEMVSLDYDNNYPSHSFLIYKDNDKWCWFENADYTNRGIHLFQSLEELISYQYQKYLDLLDSFDITNEEKSHIILTEFDRPRDILDAKGYLDYVTNAKSVVIKR